MTVKQHYPAAYVKKDKFWPTVNRTDDVYGYRNLFCSCPQIKSYNSAKDMK